MDHIDRFIIKEIIFKFVKLIMMVDLLFRRHQFRFGLKQVGFQLFLECSHFYGDFRIEDFQFLEKIFER